METLQSEGRVFLTSAVLSGRFIVPACILHYVTTEEGLVVLRRAAAVPGLPES
jgi:hypothetical protein